MASEGHRKVTCRLPPDAEQALGGLLRREGVTLRDLLLRLLAVDAATAPLRGGAPLLSWLEGLGSPERRNGVDTPLLAREQGRLANVVRRRRQEEARLAELQARRKGEEQVVSALQAQARQLAAAVREAREALSVLDVAKPTAHLAVLIGGLLDGRMDSAVSQEGVRLLVGTALLAARRSGVNVSTPPPDEVRRLHPDLPPLPLRSLLAWALAALQARPERPGHALTTGDHA